MENPFEILDTRLSRIEALLLNLNGPTEMTQPVPKKGQRNFVLEEASEFLRISKSTFRLHRPEIGGSKLGRRWVFTEAELLRFMETRRSKPLRDLRGA